MAKKRYRPEEIISKPCEADILIGQGHTVAQAIKSIGIAEVTGYERKIRFLLIEKFERDFNLNEMGHLKGCPYRFCHEKMPCVQNQRLTRGRRL